MTKLCQQYLSDIKSLFPITGKQEKKYLAKLSESVEDYCSEENVTAIEELYRGFGQPGEVVNTYISSIDSSQLIKRIRFSKWIKRGIVIFFLILLIVISLLGLLIYKEYKIFEQNEIYFEETDIID